jgi:chromosome partitioning protein
MSEMESRQRAAQIIVVANEKGGSGKSTIAMHVAVALIKAGKSVATIDLDSRQRTFTNYVENRRAWAQQTGRDLETPEHYCVEGKMDFPAAEDRAAACTALADTVHAQAQVRDYLVIDTPGHDSYLTRLAHTMADSLITPLNDSFVDLDVLATVDPTTLAVTGTSHYSQMVEDARSQRQLLDNVVFDWIVLRNRLSNLGSRNKRLVGEGLQDLAQRLNFRVVDGLAERVIFREFYPRGLTALDDLNEKTLGTRPTLSHATARLEIDNLLAALRLSDRTGAGDTETRDRDAA